MSFINDPKYQLGYKDGFEDAKAEMLIDLKRLTRKLETLSAFRTSTSTGSIIIKLGVKNN